MKKCNFFCGVAAAALLCLRPAPVDAQFQNHYNIDDREVSFPDVEHSIVGVGSNETVVTGTIHDDEKQVDNLLLMKVDAVGDPVWTWEYGTETTDERGHVLVLTDDVAPPSVIVAGTTTSPVDGDDDILVLKVNLDDGTILWQKIYHTGSTDGMNERPAMILRHESASGDPADYVVVGTTEFDAPGVGLIDKPCALSFQGDATPNWSARYLESNPNLRDRIHWPSGFAFGSSSDQIQVAESWGLSELARGIDVFGIDLPTGNNTDLVHFQYGLYGVDGENSNEPPAITRLKNPNGDFIGYALTSSLRKATSYSLIMALRLSTTLAQVWEMEYFKMNNGMDDRRRGIAIHQNSMPNELDLFSTSFEENETPQQQENEFLKVNTNNGFWAAAQSYEVDQLGKCMVRNSANSRYWWNAEFAQGPDFVIADVDPAGVGDCSNMETYMDNMIASNRTVIGLDDITWGEQDDITLAENELTPELVSCLLARLDVAGAEVKEELNEELPLAVFPNPLGDGEVLMLEIESPESGWIRVQATDVLGRAGAIRQYRVTEGQQRLELRGLNLASGLHFLDVTLIDGSTQRLKVIRSR